VGVGVCGVGWRVEGGWERGGEGVWGRIGMGLDEGL